MVNDIRLSPPKADLLRQIASISQRKASPLPAGNKLHTPVYHSQLAQLTHPKTISAKGGVSVVEDVFNQIYLKSGFLEEQEVVPAKGEQLGTRFDVYA